MSNGFTGSNYDDGYAHMKIPLVKTIQKFFWNSREIKVYIDNVYELTWLEQYLEFDLVLRLSNYHGYNYDAESLVPCVVQLGADKRSIVSYFENGILGFITNWDKKNAISLKAFMEPEKYPEEFI